MELLLPISAELHIPTCGMSNPYSGIPIVVTAIKYIDAAWENYQRTASQYHTTRQRVHRFKAPCRGGPLQLEQNDVKAEAVKAIILDRIDAITAPNITR